MWLGKCEHSGTVGKLAVADICKCPIYANVRQRRLTPLPVLVAETPKKRLTESDRLLGENSDDDDAKVDAGSASSCSNGEGDEEGLTDDLTTNQSNKQCNLPAVAGQQTPKAKSMVRS